MLPQSPSNAVIIIVEGLVGARVGSGVHALVVTAGNNGRGFPGAKWEMMSGSVRLSRRAERYNGDVQP